MQYGDLIVLLGGGRGDVEIDNAIVAPSETNAQVVSAIDAR